MCADAKEYANTYGHESVRPVDKVYHVQSA
jgi:hypothetical protein